MSILRDAFGGRTTVSDPGPWGPGMVRYGYSGSGGPVTIDSAMQLSAVFACIRLLSENVATMPLGTYERRADTRVSVPLPDYLSFQPPQGSRIDYLSQVMLSLLSAGKAFVATPRDALGVPVDLVPLQPELVKVERSETGIYSYRVGENRYTPRDVMHIRGMTMPGAVDGLSPLQAAMKSIELGLAAQDFGSSFFRNGALPAGIIEAPGEYPKSSAERVASLWNRNHRGASNAGKIGVLTGGAKFVKVTISPEEAQFLETRQFTVPEICRFFGVPPHLVADASNSTSWGSGLEEQNLSFGQMSLRPWVARIEEAHDRLLTTHGQRNTFMRLNMDALGRAGTKERYDAYAVGLASGFLTINEVRRLEDLPPVPDGDVSMAGQQLTAEDVAKLLDARTPAPAGGGGPVG